MRPIDRFMEKVAKGESCWLWTASTRGTREPRGCFWDGKKNVDACRWIYQHHNPSVEIGGLVVRHTCDVPLCVKPTHLEIGTQADNVADMWARKRANIDAIRAGAAKGRDRLRDNPMLRARGERHGSHSRDLGGANNPNAKLDDAAVANVIKLSRQGFSQRMISERTGASQKTVWAILNGKSYVAAALKARAQSAQERE